MKAIIIHFFAKLKSVKTGWHGQRHVVSLWHRTQELEEDAGMLCSGRLVARGKAPMRGR